MAPRMKLAGESQAPADEFFRQADRLFRSNTKIPQKKNLAEPKSDLSGKKHQATKDHEATIEHGVAKQHQVAMQHQVAKQYQVAKKEHYEVEDYVMVLHDEDDDDWVEI